MYVEAGTEADAKCLSASFTVDSDLLALYQGGRFELRRGSSRTEVKVPVNFTAGRAAALAVPTSNKAGTLVYVTSDALLFLDKRFQVTHSATLNAAGATTLSWNPEGSQLLALTEAGTAVILTANGQVACILSAKPQLIHAASWGPAGSQQLLYACGRDLVLAALEGKACRAVCTWRAHAGIILAVDWSAVSDRIISSGEDRQYKVWDTHGHLMHASSPMPHNVTAVRWNARGTLAAIGSFNLLHFIDSHGALQSQVTLETGSVLSLSWHPTAYGQLIALGTKQILAICKVTGATATSASWTATLQPDQCKIELSNAAAGLDTPAKSIVTCASAVQQMAAGHGHLVVHCGAQLQVFNLSQLSAPIAIVVTPDVGLLSLSERHVMAVSCSRQLSIHGMDGSHVGSWHLPNLFPINADSVSLSNDYVAFLDAADTRRICFLDLGKVKNNIASLQRSCHIRTLALSQQGTRILRKVAFMDGNGSLHMQRVTQATDQAVQLHVHVTAIRWHDTADILAALSPAQLMLWYCPEAAFGDQHLLHAICCCITMEQGFISIKEVSARSCLLVDDTGLPHAEAISPVAVEVQSLAMAQQWTQAMQLCHRYQEKVAWAVLGAYALEHGQLEAARNAYAALGMWARMAFLDASLPDSTKGGDSTLQQKAMLLLGQQEDDEAQLLQSGHVERAVRSCMMRGAWQQALKFAAGNAACREEVLKARQQFLSNSQRTAELLPEFQRPLH